MNCFKLWSWPKNPHKVLLLQPHSSSPKQFYTNVYQHREPDPNDWIKCAFTTYYAHGHASYIYTVISPFLFTTRCTLRHSWAYLGSSDDFSTGPPIGPPMGRTQSSQRCALHMPYVTRPVSLEKDVFFHLLNCGKNRSLPKRLNLNLSIFPPWNTKVNQILGLF